LNVHLALARDTQLLAAGWFICRRNIPMAIGIENMISSTLLLPVGPEFLQASPAPKDFHLPEEVIPKHFRR